MPKLTKENQGYWDRIKRAKSWLNRARAVESEEVQADGDSRSQEIFIMYWVAFNAMYGRIKEIPHGRYLRYGEDDAQWFIRWICDLDASEGRIVLALRNLSKQGRALMKSRYLSQAYWREGYSPTVRRQLDEDTIAAEEELKAGKIHSYMTSLLWGRIRVVRNQILHGCSTSRDSLNKDDLDPALDVLSVVIPLFLQIMEDRIDKETEWPPIPFPRRGSPQHPEA
jgi:hypothetical protein